MEVIGLVKDKHTQPNFNMYKLPSSRSSRAVSTPKVVESGESRNPIDKKISKKGNTSAPTLTPTMTS